MNQRLLTEADFMLGRMNVDIDGRAGDGEKEDGDRVAPARKEMAQAVEDGMLYHPIAHVTAVDIGVDWGAKSTPAAPVPPPDRPDRL